MSVVHVENSPECTLPSSETAQYLVKNPVRKKTKLTISTSPEIQSNPIRQGQFTLQGISMDPFDILSFLKFWNVYTLI